MRKRAGRGEGGTGQNDNDNTKREPKSEPETLSQDTKEKSEELITGIRYQPSGRRYVCIVVLGDICRSPRMTYHAQSFAKEGFGVIIIGYNKGSEGLPAELGENENISVVPMYEAPKMLQSFPRILAYPLRMAWLSVMLTFAFLRMVVCHFVCPEFILVQNPPAIPSSALCWIYSKLFCCDFIIDWHNYGYSLMSLVMDNKHPLIKFATWFENYFGSKADHHLCVTRAMKDDLNQRLGVSPVVLYDRPPERFRSLSYAEEMEFVEEFVSAYLPQEEQNILKRWRARDFGIIVSGTSWTEDEDFGILLNALQSYEEIRSKEPEKYPELMVFITGKGPLKEYYAEKIQKLDLKNVSIHLPWLEHHHYPKLLACADLGISLHTSSSGLDLPMKVVDMFGSGLPVAAVDFNCISELVQHKVNGLIFKNSQELSTQIVDWFQGFPITPNANHKKFRQNLQSFQSLRWHENWSHNVLPILKDPNN